MNNQNNQPLLPTHPPNRMRTAFSWSERFLRVGSSALLATFLLLLVTALFVSGKEAGMSDATVIERRLSSAFERYGMTIKTINERPDQPTGDVQYVVKDIFTTLDGSFEPSSQADAVPQWARDAYWNENFLEAGSNQHLFAAIVGLDGQFVKSYTVRFWSDGFAKLGDPNYNGYINELTKESSGWANNTLWQSSIYDPNQGMSGPWCWSPEGTSEVVCGGGLPNGEKLSTFVVWQAVQGEFVINTPTPTVEPPTPTEPTTPTPPPTVPSDPATPEPEVTPSPKITSTLPITRRVGTWIDALGLEIKDFGTRPDRERKKLDQEETVYLLKDLFTTHFGSWEPSDSMGSIDQWARDAYLKELGAPDYFDDAGADHHLFAAVIGLDGKLQRNTELVFWSDGYLMLGDEEYTGYASAFSKERSGWANIVLSNSSSYVPERGEHGPWCWMPKGAADVVCGGGLPANNHISTFAVWQAVPRSSLKQTTEDFNIFLPLISGKN